MLGSKLCLSQASALERLPEEFNKPQPCVVRKAKYLVFIWMYLVPAEVGVQPLHPVFNRDVGLEGSTEERKETRAAFSAENDVVVILR